MLMIVSEIAIFEWITTLSINCTMFEITNFDFLHEYQFFKFIFVIFWIFWVFWILIMEDASIYLSSHVDIILTQVITSILIQSPMNEQLMYDAFQNALNDIEIGKCPIRPNHTNKQQWNNSNLHEQMKPLLQYIIKSLIQDKPSNVIEYIRAIIAKKSFMTSGLDSDKNNSNHLNFIDKQKPIPIPILVLGLQKSGKSTLISKLKNDLQCNDGKDQNDCHYKPTMGFQPTNMMYKHHYIRLYDIGGGLPIRNIWNHYYHDVYGIIYILDSSCPTKQYKDSIQILHTVLQHSYIEGKPLLVYCNKQHDNHARSVNKIQLDLDLLTHYTKGQSKIMGVTMKSNVVDSRIEKGMEWLLECIIKHKQMLQIRVSQDMEKETKKQCEKKQQRERNVLKTILSQYNKKDNNVLNKEDGEALLCDIIHASKLSEEDMEIAKLLGYHRIALMMIGKMYKLQEQPRSWEKIKHFLMDIQSA